MNEWLLGEDEPDLLRGFGVLPFRPELLPIAGEIVSGGAADAAGFIKGDQILSADGELISDWMAWVAYVQQRPQQSIDVTLVRDGQRINLQIIPDAVQNDKGETVGRVGMGLFPPAWPEDMIRTLHYGPIDALVAGVERTWELSIFTLGSIKKMINGLISPKNLSGPITIAKVAGDSARSGVEAYLSFLALLSVSLGVLNLLPVPVLDGGHLLFYSIEWLKGSPVSDKIQGLAYQFGIVVVVSLMIFAFYNDIVRL